MKSRFYEIPTPALISFSGGRTSAYMLYHIIQAFDGKLPDNVFVVFANTGMERPETLEFVHQCETRWNSKVHWLEYQKDGFYHEVNHSSASRAGQPFESLITRKKSLPNWRRRWCTGQLKVEPMIRFMKDRGFEKGQYTDIIGLRYDEGNRIFKGLESAEKQGRKVHYPLSRARVTKEDVMRFWSEQDFDLGLEPHEGNCDLCFMKGKKISNALIAANPEIADWWIAQEDRLGQTFSSRYSIRYLVKEATGQEYEKEEILPEDFDVECGLTCAPDDIFDEAA